MAKLYLGLSGYDYKEWQGDGLFYPREIKRTQFLQYYASQFNSVEFNGSFQRMPNDAMVAKCIASTPADFCTSPKMVQQVSHFKRLNDEAIEVAKEFVKVVTPLAEMQKLGAIFLQLPPNMKSDAERLSTFLDSVNPDSKLRWAIEFRHESWKTPEIENLLSDRNVAWIIAETEEEPAELIDTADFIYVRLRKLDYTQKELTDWIAKLDSYLKLGKDCYVYCRHKDTDGPWRWGEKIKKALLA